MSKNGWATLREMADAIGISKATVYQWNEDLLNHKSNLVLQAHARAAEAAHVPLEEWVCIFAGLTLTPKA